MVSYQKTSILNREGLSGKELEESFVMVVQEVVHYVIKHCTFLYVYFFLIDLREKKVGERENEINTDLI